MHPVLADRLSQLSRNVQMSHVDTPMGLGSQGGELSFGAISLLALERPQMAKSLMG